MPRQPARKPLCRGRPGEDRFQHQKRQQHKKGVGELVGGELHLPDSRDRTAEPDVYAADEKDVKDDEQGDGDRTIEENVHLPVAEQFHSVP